MALGESCTGFKEHTYLCHAKNKVPYSDRTMQTQKLIGIDFIAVYKAEVSGKKESSQV